MTMKSALRSEPMNLTIEMPRDVSAVVLSFQPAPHAFAPGEEAGDAEYASWSAGVREYESWSTGFGGNGRLT
jgi:hypothetical protein